MEAYTVKMSSGYEWTLVKGSNWMGFGQATEYQHNRFSSATIAAQYVWDYFADSAEDLEDEIALVSAAA